MFIKLYLKGEESFEDNYCISCFVWQHISSKISFYTFEFTKRFEPTRLLQISTNFCYHQKLVNYSTQHRNFSISCQNFDLLHQIDRYLVSLGKLFDWKILFKKMWLLFWNSVKVNNFKVKYTCSVEYWPF